MSILSKLAEIAENEEKVYQAGYDAGYKEGGAGSGNENFIKALNGEAVDELVIPEGLTQIHAELFSETQIGKLVIPSSIKTIGDRAFYRSGIYELVFAEDSQLTTIGAYAFWGSYNITHLRLPDKITHIGAQAFYPNMTEIEICRTVEFGSDIQFIDSWAFYGSTGSKFDFSKAKSIPKISSEGIDPQGAIAILVPGRLYSEWVNREDWAPYKEYIIPSGGKSVPDTTQFTMHVDAGTLKTLLDNRAGTNVGKYELKTDEPCKYIRIYGDGKNGESFANAQNISNTVTGRYMIYAYRLPTSNTIRPRAFQIYANTNGKTVNGEGDNFYVKAYTDDKWHVDVIDVAVAIASSTDVRNGKYNSQFTDNNGSFTAKKLRFDWFNEGSAVPTSDYIDIAYIGFCDTIEKARSLDPDYTGAEFDAMYLWNTGAFNLKTTDSGMTYVSRTTNYKSLNSNEAFVYLTGNTDYVITPNTTMYAGVLYRASTDRSYGEMYSCCANNDVANADWYTRLRFGYYYELGNEWHFGVLKFNAGTNIDGAARLLRFDYLNGVENNGKDYTVDIGFVKFFNSVEEGEAYFEEYRQKYNI